MNEQKIITIGKYTIKVSKNPESVIGNKRNYHLYENGKFVMTFWSMQILKKYLALCERDERQNVQQPTNFNYQKPVEA